jgi:hypothetical protein
VIQILVLVHRTLQFLFPLFQTEADAGIRCVLLVLIFLVLSLLILLVLLFVLFAFLCSSFSRKFDEVGVLSSGQSGSTDIRVVAA